MCGMNMISSELNKFFNYLCLLKYTSFFFVYENMLQTDSFKSFKLLIKLIFS